MKINELFETKDVRISNVREGDPLYNDLLKLTSAEELAKVVGNAITAGVAKRYKGASFIVVGFKDPSRKPYFRIDKADIKKDLS